MKLKHRQIRNTTFQIISMIIKAHDDSIYIEINKFTQTIYN